MKIKPTAEIAAFLQPIAECLGVEILEVKWDGRARALTVVIDAENGVDMNLCADFHRAIDAPLDELDPTFGEAYTLNCSSAGIDRPIKTDRDFQRRLGERVEVKLYAAEDGKKEFEGELLSFDEATFTIATDGGERTFLREKVAKVCLYIDI